MENISILENVLKNHIETCCDGRSTVKEHKETVTSDPGSEAFYKPLSIQTQMPSGTGSGLPGTQILFEDLHNPSFKGCILHLLVPIHKTESAV